MKDYEIVIGLEVHSELNTESKIFCSCKNQFGGEPNTHCCPVCSGMPGTLPVLNKKAVMYTVKAGLACGCNISKFSKFDRKNYYYPDLPKAYQISQFDLPLCVGGKIDFQVDGEDKSVRLNRIHLEEDAGKLIHSEYGGGTLVDYNRCGVPLIEIVTEPDMRSPEEAIAFLETLRSILKYTGVSDCKMEQGSLRCDINVSIRKKGDTEFGTRTEMKNVNSFKAAYRAMQYESKRQIKLLEEGKEVIQETRRWDDNSNKSYTMRTKEDAQDYRYFPDPDLVPVVLTDKQIEDIKATLPKLPNERKKQYVEEYGLPAYDADVLTKDKEIADYFDAMQAKYNNPKTLSNWIMGDVMRMLKENDSDEIIIPIAPEALVDLLQMIDKGSISLAASKQVFEEMWKTGEKADAIVAKLGLTQINDTEELEKMVVDIIKNNPKPYEDYKSGNTKARAFFVGQVMKATKGKANPKIVNEILNKELDK